MRLDELVAISHEVAGTRSRTRKVELLSVALAGLHERELDAGVSYLAGEPRQQRLELGPTAVYGATATPAPEPTLEVLDVDHRLQGIADVRPGSGSRTRRIERFVDLLSHATETEQEFLRSLALRELRQGALEGVLVQAIARAGQVAERHVRRAAMLSGDLRATAKAALVGGEDALTSFALQVGVPLQPMLAGGAPDLDAALADLGEAVVETKLDGARVQVHRDGAEVTVFTRNLREVTARVPEVVEATRALPVDAVVLDGEAIAFADDGRPLAFQETMQRFGRDRDDETGTSDLALHVRFFDVLHLDGRDVLDDPLRERLRALESIVPAELRAEQLRTADPDVARDFLARTLAAGHEGVMVKDPGSAYEAGRRGSGWRKVKPVHTLDLVVIAAEWGSGRRRGWLSNLHLAARLDDGSGLVMLGKTFKGLTDELLTWQTAALLERETHRDGHVVHVRPELVVEIALDGVVRSPRYPGGLALRFARVRGYRDDKTPRDADDLATVRAIHEGRRIPTG